MYTRFLASILLAVFFSATAQQPYFSYKALEYGKAPLSFPVFSSKNTIADANINRFLQLSYLDMLEWYYNIDLLDGLSVYEDGPDIYYEGINFEVAANSSQLLSVRFILGHYGGSYYHESQYRNFNAQTGQPVFISDLFTAQGLEYLIIQAKARWDARLDSLVEDFGEGIINECRTCFEEDPHAVIESFYIQDNDLYIDVHSCFSSHFIINSSIVFTANELNGLSDYGKSMLGISGKPVSARESKYPAKELLVWGTTAKDAMLALIVEKGTTAHGYYTDKKNNIHIALKGTHKEGNITLTATDYKDNEIASLNAIVKGDTLSIAYKDEAGNKIPSVMLVRE